MYASNSNCSLCPYSFRVYTINIKFTLSYLPRGGVSPILEPGIITYFTFVSLVPTVMPCCHRSEVYFSNTEVKFSVKTVSFKQFEICCICCLVGSVPHVPACACRSCAADSTLLLLFTSYSARYVLLEKHRVDLGGHRTQRNHQTFPSQQTGCEVPAAFSWSVFFPHFCVQSKRLHRSSRAACRRAAGPFQVGGVETATRLSLRTHSHRWILTTTQWLHCNITFLGEVPSSTSYNRLHAALLHQSDFENKSEMVLDIWFSLSLNKIKLNKNVLPVVYFLLLYPGHFNNLQNKYSYPSVNIVNINNILNLKGISDIFKNTFFGLLPEWLLGLHHL